MSPVQPFLLSALPPTKSQRRLAGVVAVILLICFLATLPLIHRQLPRNDAFIPIVDTVLFLNDLITAALLYAHFSVARSRALLALGSGYLLTALIIVPHALTFPGLFSPRGLIGAGLQSTVWLWVFWHMAIPVTVICYAFLKRTGELPTRPSPKSYIIASISGITIFTAVLTWLATAGARLLPPIMVDAVNANTVWSYFLAPPMVATFLVALALMWKRHSSVLGLWLLVVLWAWLIETALLSMTSSRFSLAWYAGKIFGLLSSSFVLLALLAEATMLHAQLAISVAAEKRESESRRMTMEVMVAAISHELQQPLSAIVANSVAEASMLACTPPDWDELRATIDDISRDGRRATEIIESIRSMFATGSRDLTLINVNELIEESLAILRIKLQTNNISVAFESSSVPPVRGHKGQLLQVLSNLITNAIESMAEISDRIHLLRIQSVAQDSQVSLLIEDSGTGIDRENAERLFEPFFTTKGKGMGLGLAICRSIVESHRGHLSVIPGIRFGSLFRVDLPVANAEKLSDIKRERVLAS